MKKPRKKNHKNTFKLKKGLEKQEAFKILLFVFLQRVKGNDIGLSDTSLIYEISQFLDVEFEIVNEAEGAALSVFSEVMNRVNSIKPIKQVLE